MLTLLYWIFYNLITNSKGLWKGLKNDVICSWGCTPLFGLNGYFLQIDKTFLEVREMKHTFEIQKGFIFLFPNYLLPWQRLLYLANMSK